MQIHINTTKIMEVQNIIMQEKRNVLNGRSNFYAGAFGSTGNLSSALLKINNTFLNISKNLENIGIYLKNYVDEIESYENNMSGNNSMTYSEGSKYVVENQMLQNQGYFSYEMDSTKLFEIKRSSKNPGKVEGNTASNGSANGQSDSSSTANSGNQQNTNSINSGDVNFSFQDNWELDLDLFDFNLDALEDLEWGDFSSIDFSGLESIIFPNLENINLGALGFLGIGSLGSLTHINLGELNLGNLGNFEHLENLFPNFDNLHFENISLPDLTLSDKLVIEGLLGIENIPFGDFPNLGELLNHYQFDQLDLSNFSFQLSQFPNLQEQLRLGNISIDDISLSFRNLFSGMENFDFSQFMNSANNFSTGSMSGALSNQTGAVSTPNVASALFLGFGALSGVGLASFVKQGKTSKKEKSESKEKTYEERKNSFAGLGDAIMRGTSFSTAVTADAALNHAVNFDSEEVVQTTKKVPMFSSMSFLVTLDYETILQNVFYRLKKFNQIKKLSTYWELVDSANQVQNITTRKNMEERISCLIPTVLPDTLKNRYLYYELNHQNVFSKDLLSYQQLQAVINNSSIKQYKWLDLKPVKESQKTRIKSELNLIDQTVNCGDVSVSSNFYSVFSMIDDKISEIVDTIEQIYTIEVPKEFHSSMVLNETSSDYDRILERLESLSVQAILNSMSLERARTYLSTEIVTPSIANQNLLCFQDMIRMNEKKKQEVILVARIGDGVTPYRYFAWYEGVGLKEIHSFDVKDLMKHGFQLKED